MYLVSIYFDDKTNRIIQNHIDQIASGTGNTFMLDGNVPPHITVCALETKQEDLLIELFRELASTLRSGQLQWVSVGQFFPYVIYISPVLNAYLQNMIQIIYNKVNDMEGTNISPYYRPYQWLPHTTIGKKLAKDEMQKAFEIMQRTFVPFDGTVVKIGLARTNPYEEIVTIQI